MFLLVKHSDRENVAILFDVFISRSYTIDYCVAEEVNVSKNRLGGPALH